ncbi:collagen alpha-1(XII) chain [Fundulus heteroclitus]|uniref:collagen alpha-1(XII) chain n=1 Tax=Fundulus heteroclitus TaxID=8078 RepID=UPI00165BECB9|nr:collagen alpha-1(XII) chain [Fundulus heteroclitus]
MDDLLVLLVLLLSSGPQCEMAKADIVMLVDGSGSISGEDFKRMKSFISQIVQNFHIGPNEVQIGLTQYSYQPRTEWYLNTHKNKQSLLEAINDIKQMAGGTMTGQALDHILNRSFKPAVGMRADSKKYVVLITDGAATDNVTIPAKNLKDTGIELYVIGVGPDVQSKRAIEQLKTIASEDVESHVYLISTFQSTQNISARLCRGATNVKRLPSYE